MLQTLRSSLLRCLTTPSSSQSDGSHDGPSFLDSPDNCCTAAAFRHKGLAPASELL